MSDTRISPPSDDERRELEARYVQVRLVELHGRPPDPTFDETHLRAIHRHIFPQTGSSIANSRQCRRDCMSLTRQWMKTHKVG